MELWVCGGECTGIWCFPPKYYVAVELNRNARYSGRVNDLPTRIHQVVVKQSKVRTGALVDMTDEAEMLKYLGAAKSQHVVRLAGPVKKIKPGDDLYLDGEGEGKVGRLFL